MNSSGYVDRLIFQEPWKEQAFQLLLAFTRHREEDLKRKAFVSIGLFCVHYSDYLLRTELKELYQNILTDPESEINVRTQVLRNLESFLNEEERKMLNREANRKVENLKEMGETTSGLSSSVIQCYLPGVLNCYFNRDQTVRTVASEVVLLTLQQGLVHPGQINYFRQIMIALCKVCMQRDNGAEQTIPLAVAN
ncbi:nipped-B protein [Trichinella spiralis]|uniref:nipped-B protein n=1 Tax=Trichinella spiralis TaxID=6334 RepID=UPI0001EFDD6E|nr:nipped-B protein [Trichinella spiralis]